MQCVQLIILAVMPFGNYANPSKIKKKSTEKVLKQFYKWNQVLLTLRNAYGMKRQFSSFISL